MKTCNLVENQISEKELAAYERDGFLVMKEFLEADKMERVRLFFDKLAAEGKPIPGWWQPNMDPEVAKKDPLKRYPRVIMAQRFFPLAKEILLDSKTRDVLALLFGEEPLAVMSMYYYKPPGSLGQALHQDNFYLKVRPETCIAVWIAIDPSGPENGGLFVVPGTHRLDVICPGLSDQSVSFSRHEVKPPANAAKAIQTHLNPGDALFFNGSLMHGSTPNRSESMWRRSIINHYIPFSSTHISKFYDPILDFNGNEVKRKLLDDGGPCGDTGPSSYA